jgi:hypothetical protein
MRKFARAWVVAVVALLSSVALGVMSAFMAALALGATTALIVPGTGTPNANIVSDYMQNARDRFIAPFTTCKDNTCTLEGINYPASFWPLGFIGNWCPGYKCDTWNDSVGTGVQNLDTELRDVLANTSNNVVIFGYSQGGAVVSDELRNLGDLTPEERARISVVTIGNAFNPDGGIFTRLGFLPTIPILNITPGPAMPTDTGIPINSIGFQYDPVMYAPEFWGNPFSMLNALAAFETVHGYYLTPNGNGPTDPIAYGYTEPEIATILAGPCPGPNCRVDSNGNKYWMIPAKSLPIVDLLMSAIPAGLQPVAKPVADLVSPVLKVLIDLGYDWSGDPGKEKWLSILPFNPIQNWPAVGINLVAATIQGIQAFIGDLGGLTSGLPLTTPSPVSPTTVSTLAATARITATDTTKATQTAETIDSQSTPKLTVVNDTSTNDETVQQTTVKDETTADKKSDDKKADETLGDKKADDKKADDKKSDDKKADDKKADQTATGTTKSDETATDTTKSDEKKVDNDKKSDTDKKDADTAKAAA